MLSRAEAFRRAHIDRDDCAKGGKVSQASGNGHRWTGEDAKHWGRLGGQCMQENRRREERVCWHCGERIDPGVAFLRERTSSRLMHQSCFDRLREGLKNIPGVELPLYGEVPAAAHGADTPGPETK